LHTKTQVVLPSTIRNYARLFQSTRPSEIQFNAGFAIQHNHDGQKHSANAITLRQLFLNLWPRLINASTNSAINHPLYNHTATPKCVQDVMLPQCSINKEAPKCAPTQFEQFPRVDGKQTTKKPKAQPHVDHTALQQHNLFASASIDTMPQQISVKHASFDSLRKPTNTTMSSNNNPPGNYGPNFVPPPTIQPKIISYAQAATKKHSPALNATKQALQKDLGKKISAATTISNSKTVKKTKLSPDKSTITGSTIHKTAFPSPIKKGTTLKTINKNSATNKRVQLNSPPRETKEIPANKSNTPTSPLPIKKLDYAKALNLNLHNSDSSTSSDDTIERMLNNDNNNQSDGSTTSEESRIARYKKMAEEKKASTKKAKTPSFLSDDSESTEVPNDAGNDWENLSDDDANGTNNRSSKKQSYLDPTAKPFKHATNLTDDTPGSLLVNPKLPKTSKSNIKTSSLKAKAAENSPEFSPSDYHFDQNCPVTSILTDSHTRIATFLYNTYASSQGNKFMYHPNQSPIQIHFEDAEFSILNRDGSFMIKLPESISDSFPTDQNTSLDNIDESPKATSNQNTSTRTDVNSSKPPHKTPTPSALNSRDRRKQRRANQNVSTTIIPSFQGKTEEEWMKELLRLSPSQISQLQEYVLLDFPATLPELSTSTGINRTNYQCTLPKYQKGKSLSCSSSISASDARDKLLGYLIALQAGLPSQAQLCKISNSIRISSSFKAYASTEQTKPDQDAMEESNPDEPQLATQGELWWKQLCQGEDPTTTLNYRGRDVHLDFWEIPLTPEAYQSTKDTPMMKRLGWQAPDSPTTIYRITVQGWGKDYHLQADSYISYSDAYLKSVYYSELHDVGGTSPDDSPIGLPDSEMYFHQVPLFYTYYPKSITANDPNIPLDTLAPWYKPANSPSADPDDHSNCESTGSVESMTHKATSSSKSAPKPQKSTLKPSSFSKPSKSEPVEKSEAQKLMDLLTSVTDDGLELNIEGKAYYANIILEPPPSNVHPWEHLSASMQELIRTAQEIDESFSLLSISDSHSNKHPPLISPDNGFPASPIKLGPYARTNKNQMQLVKPGSKYADGTSKKQPNIYACVKFLSAYTPGSFINWVGPEMDMKGIGFNIKGFQCPATVTRHLLMGIRPDFCTEGVLRNVARAIREEIRADAQAGKLSRVDAESADIKSMHVKRQGLRDTKLVNPTNISKYSMNGYAFHLKQSLAVEVPEAKQPFFSHYLRSADNSGSLKAFCGEKTVLVLAPVNPAGMREELSAKWMSKMRANAKYIHNTATVTLKGIVDPYKQVRSQWQEGHRENSPWQKKTVTVAKILLSMTDSANNQVFHAVNQVVIGQEAGSTRVACYRKRGIEEFAAKVEHSPTAFVYHYGINYLKLTVKCMDKVVSGCNFEEVLQIENTTWNADNMSVDSPFVDNEDAFVREMDESGFTIDISAITGPNNDTPPTMEDNTDIPASKQNTAPPTDPNESTIPPQQQEWANRLNLSGNASFTSKNSEAVSRADDATINTDGANSFTPCPIEKQRNLRNSIIEKARLNAKRVVQTAKKIPKAADEDDSLSINSDTSITSFSQGQPTHKGSAASIPNANANMQRASKDGGASA
jgi:hypothetical protein